jgi:hypothetical protein
MRRPILAVLVLGLSTLLAHALEKADRIIVHKKDHTMELMHAGNVIKIYKIALGTESGWAKAARG